MLWLVLSVKYYDIFLGFSLFICKIEMIVPVSWSCQSQRKRFLSLYVINSLLLIVLVWTPRTQLLHRVCFVGLNLKGDTPRVMISCKIQLLVWDDHQAKKKLFCSWVTPNFTLVNGRCWILPMPLCGIYWDIPLKFIFDPWMWSSKVTLKLIYGFPCSSGISKFHLVTAYYSFNMQVSSIHIFQILNLLFSLVTILLSLTI